MIIIASNGLEVIDNRPEAEIANSNRQHFEERYANEQKHKLAEQLKRNKHPFAARLMSACGMLQKGDSNMYQFGSNEYGNKGGFKITCQCGREARIVPIHCRDNEKLKITLEIRCVCGNKYGATIHEEGRIK